MLKIWWSLIFSSLLPNIKAWSLVLWFGWAPFNLCISLIHTPSKESRHWTIQKLPFMLPVFVPVLPFFTIYHCTSAHRQQKSMCFLHCLSSLRRVSLNILYLGWVWIQSINANCVSILPALCINSRHNLHFSQSESCLLLAVPWTLQ